MFEDIQEHMRALIAQHGSALVALTALRQHLKAQQNDEQTISLENHVPHIDVQVEFNQGMSEFAHERRNRLLRERHAKQREQPYLHNDAL
jgi:predicted KAP-like P-loop ATPase